MVNGERGEVPAQPERGGDGECDCVAVVSTVWMEPVIVFVYVVECERLLLK